MEHLTLALYVLFFTAGSGGAGALAVLAWRHRSPFFAMLLVIDLLYGVGLAASMAFFYIGNVAGFLPSESSSWLQRAATVANASQVLLYLQVTIFALSLDWTEKSRLVLKVATALFASLVTLQGGWLLAASWFPLPRPWSSGWLVVVTLLLLGALLLVFAHRQSLDPLKFLARWWGIALVVFVPSVVLEDWIGSLGLYAQGTFQVDFLFSFALNVLAIVALLRSFAAKPGVRGNPATYEVAPALAQDFGLTPREIEIVPLVAQGLANKEIAFVLGISPATVRTHLSNLFQKTGARSRIDLVNRLR
jgi:DNA-binding CsgD family transcriptional regulator